MLSSPLAAAHPASNTNSTLTVMYVRIAPATAAPSAPISNATAYTYPNESL